MTGLKTEWLRLMNMTKIIGDEFPEYIAYQQRLIYTILEDVHSVASMTELQEAIDSIGTGAGTIFIEAGTHIVDTTIDIDNCGSLVIYGHGDNTILKANNGITIFHITCCASLLIKTIALDISAYTLPATDIQAILIDEVNDNIVRLEDVTIHGIGGGNFGIGVEINSNNCVIDNCVITQVKSGIFVNGADRTLITNNTSATNAEYGLVLNLAGVTTITGNAFIANGAHGIYNYDSDYSLIGNNGCNDNLSNGIHLELCEHCTVSANAVAGNLLNGIHLTQASYCTLSGNNCNNNDSNTVNPQAGIFITTNSDYNTISANSANNNNNATYPVGIGYGILIAAATCNENIVAANNANGNDIDFQDSGTDTIIEYFVQDEFELQDAINSIGSKSGIINIEASFTIAATIGINDPAVHGGSYIIRGDGSNTTLTPSGNFSCFNVREARSVIFENFAISAVNLVGTTAAIYILENSDNAIFVDNITIVGDGTNGYGIQISSPNCRIKNCNISSMLNGIVPTDEHCIITGNICNSNNNYGIFLNTADYITVQSNTCRLNQIGIYLTSSNKNLILGNTVEANTADGIFLNTSDQNTFEGNIIDGNITTNVGTDHAGITLTNSLNNFIIGNTIINNANGGAGFGYGVYIVNAACTENIVRSNNLSGNNIKWKDVGVNSDFEYLCSTNADIQDAIDSIAAKSGTITIITDNIAITVPILIGGGAGGDYIIKGDGIGSQLITGDNQCFVITNARSVLLQNFKIDASAITGRNTVVIEIDEAADNLIIVDNIDITGIVARGWGIECVSDYIQITNCRISTIDMGIYISGDYCKIESNVCNGMDEYGIDCIGDYAIITNNICNSNNDSGIQMNGAAYCNVSQNQCHSNNNYGIFVFNLSNMVLADNIFTLNATGIRVEDSNYVSINGNTSSDNITSGIVIAPTSSYNIVIGNTCIDNAAGYGIIVAATCVENIVKSNNLSGNNWQVWDLGTNSDFEYICSTNAEIQDAVDSIAAKSGRIKIITDDITINTKIDIDGNGDYLIEGDGIGSNLETGNNKCFDITLARSVILKNFRIDATGLTGAMDIIDVSEAGDNVVIIENIVIVGDGTNGYGIELNSNNCRIKNCVIDNVNIGINVLSNSNIINGNNANNCASYGIQVSADYNNITSNICNSNLTGIYVLNGTGNSINNNIVQTNTQNGIYLNGSSYNSLNDNICDGNDSNTANPQAGIYIDSNSDNNSIIGNTSINNNNGGAGEGYGVYIGNANCNMNIVRSNNISGNNIAWNDLGTNSDFEYRCSTGQEIQDAIDSIVLKSGIIHILSGTITLTAIIDVDGGGDYIIEGEGVGSVIDCGGNRTAFNITNAKSCILRNFKIDADDHTANFTDSITVNEGSDNHVIIEHVSVVNPNGAKYGRGVHIVSDNCVVQNCTINKTYIGIQIDGIHNLVLNNNITATGNSGISVLGDDNEIIGNDCNNNDISAIKLLSCDRNIVSNNNCNYNGSAGQGIYLSASHENVIIGNQCSGNFAHGIHIYQSNYNNIIGNNCNGNDYDQVNSGGGIWIDTNSDYNIVSGNMLYDNVNIGGGTSFGINIFDNTCNGNCIGVNLYRTNDTDFSDSGTGTIIFGDDTVYGASWNANMGTATKNAIRNKIEDLITLITASNAANMIGETNAVLIPCAYQISDIDFGVRHDVGGAYIENVSSLNDYMSYICPLPTNRGGKKLYIGDCVLDIHQADGTDDFIRNLRVFAVDYNSLYTHIDDNTFRTWQGKYTYAQAGADISAYTQAVIEVWLNGGDGRVAIASVLLECWYDD